MIGGFFLVVVVIAGLAGLALIALPGSTEWYFSWTLRPRWAAAVIGGMYLGSTLAFGWALTRPEDSVRALTYSVFGLAAPTLVFTAVHRQVFEFGRWQAVFWVVLFTLAPPVSLLAGLLRGRRPPSDESPIPAAWRAGWGVASVAALVGAVINWERGSTLTIRYLGCWASFAAILLAVPAVTGRRDDSHCVSVIVRLLAAGLALGVIRGQFA